MTTIQRKFSRFAFLLAAVLLAACEGEVNRGSLDRVLESQAVNGQTAEIMVQQLAGRNGRIEWSLEPLNGEQQRVVATVLSRQTGHELELHFEHNLSDDSVTLTEVHRDGEALSVVDGALAMLAMRLAAAEIDE
ncbi:hypothetical protein [Kiloniella sp. b19]|uniref:hypothetical protein n=1 Tax=Kiloniella sp. GXU_MW_B19 TaxID=3141326 RepID=UPI0031DC4142